MNYDTNINFHVCLEHLSRLHLILKPFMLRRIKKDVENELSDKIEILMYCPLTSRQKMLYSGNLIIPIHFQRFGIFFNTV